MHWDHQGLGEPAFLSRDVSHVQRCRGRAADMLRRVYQGPDKAAHAGAVDCCAGRFGREPGSDAAVWGAKAALQSCLHRCAGGRRQHDWATCSWWWHAAWEPWSALRQRAPSWIRSASGPELCWPSAARALAPPGGAPSCRTSRVAPPCQPAVHASTSLCCLPM